MQYFTQTYPLRVLDADETGRLSTAALLAIFQDIAIRASDFCGATDAWLHENGTVWFLQSISLKVHRDLSYLDTLTVKTYIGEFGGLFAKRGYKAFLGDELVAECLSFWFMVDMSRRRPIKAPPEIVGLYYDAFEAQEIPEERVKLTLPEGAPLATKSFEVRLSDIDENAHLNNTVYAAYAHELVPEPIVEFNIEYKTEAAAGDVLTLELYRDIITDIEKNLAPPASSCHGAESGSAHRRCDIIVYRNGEKISAIAQVKTK